MKYISRVDPALVVNKYYELIRRVKAFDDILPTYVTNEYYYNRIGIEFEYKPDTVRRILLREIHGIVYKKKKKKGGRK